MENTSDSFMPRPLLFCLKSGRSVCYSVPDNSYDRKSLANRACVNYVTLCKRLREPDTWILSELLAVMQVLKMDFGELYEKGA